MAEIRFNYGDKFTQTTNTNTGIGSTIPAAKLDIAGGASAGSVRVSGIATLSSYQGFVNTKLSTTEDLIVEAGQSGSVSGEVVIGTGQTISVSTGATTGQGGIQSLKVYETFMPPVGGTVDRPTDVKPGMVYYNKDFKTIEFWDGNFWKQVDNTTRGCRGLLGGSTGDGQLIHYINISSQGNSVDFGLLTNAKSELNGMSDGTRGLFANGYQNASPSTRLNDIEYITIASEGDAIDFGDSTMKRNSGDSGCSSSTRGVMGGGYTANNSPANPQNVIDYVEIQTLGNALDFGDLAYERYGHGACSSPTRGLFGGGGESPAGAQKDITFITIASKGNSVQFGNLTKRRMYLGSSGNSVRGLFGGGYTSGSADGQKTIDYVTIASEGNAIDFGERTQGGSYGSATASQTRFVMFGSRAPSVDLNIIDFVNIASTGDAIDFGDISWSTGNHAIGALSDSHGGLGGF